MYFCIKLGKKGKGRQKKKGYLHPSIEGQQEAKVGSIEEMPFLYKEAGYYRGGGPKAPSS